MLVKNSYRLDRSFSIIRGCVNMRKQILRKNMIQQLKKLPEDERNAIQLSQQQLLFQSSLWKNALTIGITVSKGFEWDTKQIIRQGWKENKIIAIPKCNPFDKTMTYHQITTFEQLEVVYAGIEEPVIELTSPVKNEILNLCIVPGIVFDKNGYRIGFGGGYYDRMLPSIKAPTLSICSELQIVSSLPKESHDLPVDYLLTEKLIFLCISKSF